MYRYWVCFCWMTHFHPVLSTDICLHVEFWWPECLPSSGLCQVVLWWLLPGASSTSQSPSTRGRSTLKDVLLGMFPTKFDMVHDLLLFFIEVHDYVSPSVPAKIVYVTEHGNIYCVSFLGIWGYWSMDLFWLSHVITSDLGTASDNRCLTF